MSSAADEKRRVEVDRELDDLIGDIARRQSDDEPDTARQARAAAAVAEAERRERMRMEAAEKARADAEAKAKAEEEASARAEAEARAKAEEEARARAEAEARAKAEEEARARAEADARAKAEEEARARAEAEAKAKAEEEARARAEAEAKAKAEEEARAEAEAAEKQESEETAGVIRTGAIAAVGAVGAGVHQLSAQRMRGNLHDLSDDDGTDDEVDGALSGKVIPLHLDRSGTSRLRVQDASVAEAVIGDDDIHDDVENSADDDVVGESDSVVRTAGLAAAANPVEGADKSSADIEAFDDEHDPEPASLMAMPYPTPPAHFDEGGGLATPSPTWSDRRLLPPWLAMGLPIAAVSTVALAAALATLFAPKGNDQNQLAETSPQPTPTGAAVGDAASTETSDGTAAGAATDGTEPESSLLDRFASRSTGDAGADGGAAEGALSGDLDSGAPAQTAPKIANLQPAEAPPARAVATGERVAPPEVRDRAAQTADNSNASPSGPAVGTRNPATNQSTTVPPRTRTTAQSASGVAEPAAPRRSTSRTSIAARSQPVISLASLKLAPRPSSKPAGRARVTRAVATVSAPTTRPRSTPAPQVVAPRGRLPVSFHRGAVMPGSAASVAAHVLSDDGRTPSKSERRILAARVDAALDGMVVGQTRTITPPRSGVPIDLTIRASRGALRRYRFERAEEVGFIPNGLKISGGWYAVDSNNVRLRPTPSAASEMATRPLRAGVLVESLGTYEDYSGQIWRLVGKRGVAIGYVADGDLRRAVEGDRSLGLPYNRAHGLRVEQDVVVETECRTVDAGLQSGTRSFRRVEVCRNLAGHWVSAQSGEQLTADAQTEGSFQLAAYAPSHAEDTALEAAVLSMAGAQGATPAQIDAFADGLQTMLEVAEDGDIVAQLAPGGGFAKLLPEQTEIEADIAPVDRADWVGQMPATIEVQTGWVTAPAGASLRPLPTHRTRTAHARIEPGLTVKRMGEVTDRHGANWQLVGQNGVAFGYVLAEEVVPLGPDGGQIYELTPNVVVRDLVLAEAPCRRVNVDVAGQTQQLTSCLSTQGVWRVRSDDIVVRDFAEQDTSAAIF